MALNKGKGSKPIVADLDEFDPSQFDINFSSASSKGSQPPTPKKKEEEKEDKKMVDQLSAIANLMKRIDGQLANKDRVLNSTTTTPNRPNPGYALQFGPQKKSPIASLIGSHVQKQLGPGNEKYGSRDPEKSMHPSPSDSKYPRESSHPREPSNPRDSKYPDPRASRSPGDNRPDRSRVPKADSFRSRPDDPDSRKSSSRDQPRDIKESNVISNWTPGEKSRIPKSSRRDDKPNTNFDSFMSKDDPYHSRPRNYDDRPMDDNEKKRRMRMDDDEDEKLKNLPQVKRAKSEYDYIPGSDLDFKGSRPISDRYNKEFTPNEQSGRAQRGRTREFDDSRKPPDTYNDYKYYDPYLVEEGAEPPGRPKKRDPRVSNYEEFIDPYEDSIEPRESDSRRNKDSQPTDRDSYPSYKNKDPIQEDDRFFESRENRNEPRVDTARSDKSLKKTRFADEDPYQDKDYRRRETERAPQVTRPGYEERDEERANYRRKDTDQAPPITGTAYEERDEARQSKKPRNSPVQSRMYVEDESLYQARPSEPEGDQRAIQEERVYYEKPRRPLDPNRAREEMHKSTHLVKSPGAEDDYREVKESYYNYQKPNKPDEETERAHYEERFDEPGRGTGRSKKYHERTEEQMKEDLAASRKFADSAVEERRDVVTEGIYMVNSDRKEPKQENYEVTTLIIPDRRSKRSDSNDKAENKGVKSPMNISQIEQRISSNKLLAPPMSVNSAEKESQYDDTLIIPLLTYAKLKNFKKKSEELDMGFESEEDKALLSEPELEQKRTETLNDLLDLGQSIVKDLEEANPRNTFVHMLKKQIEELDRNRPTLEDGTNPDMNQKLEDFVEDVNKLEVKEKDYSSKKEEAKFKEFARRKSMQRILSLQEQQGMTGTEILSKSRTKEELKDYVVTFLKNYAERMRKVNTPISETMAAEADSAVDHINKIETDRPEDQSYEMLRLMVESIHSKFHADEKKSSPPQTPSIGMGEIENDSKLMKFNDFLRGLSKLSEIPFKELEGMVTDPSNTMNFLSIRHEQIMSKNLDPKAEKDNDLLVLNGMVENKRRMEELIVNLSKEVLPPRNYTEKKDLDDSGDFMHIKFMDLKKKETVDSMPNSMHMQQSSFIEDVSFAPTKVSRPEGKKPGIIEPNMIESEDESSPIMFPTQSNEIDYRYDLAEKLELLIERMQDERDNIMELRKEIKEEARRSNGAGSLPHEQISEVNKCLEKCAALANAGQPCEPVYLNLQEKVGSNSEPKGLLKAWPRFERELARLKKANSDVVLEMHKALAAVQRENKQVAEELKEQMEQSGDNSDPSAVKNAMREVLEEVKKNKKEAKMMQKLRDALAQVHKTLSKGEIEQKLEKESNVDPLAKPSPEAVAQKREEQREKIEELEDRVDKIHDLLEECKEKPDDYDSADDGIEGQTEYDTESRPISSSPREMVRPAGAEQDQRYEEEEAVTITTTKGKLKHTLDQLRALARAIISSIDAAEDLNKRQDTLSPLDKKTENELTQSQYEFARNGLLAVLAQPETTLLLNQRSNLPPLAKQVKKECDNVVEITEEDPSRDNLKSRTQEFYEALLPIKLDNEEELEELEKKVEEIKEQERAQEEVEKENEKIAQPMRERNIAELVEHILQEIKDAERVVKNSGNNLSDDQKEQLNDKADKAKDVLTSHPIPPAEAVTHVKELAIDLSKSVNNDGVLSMEINRDADRLAELILEAKEYEMQRAAEELKEEGQTKGIDLTENGQLAESQLLGPNQLKESALKLSEVNELTPEEKEELEEKLEVLKKAVAECIDCAEETMYIKANETINFIEQQKSHEPDNKLIDRMQRKAQEVKDTIDEGDNNENVINLVRDVSQANSKNKEGKNINGDKPIDATNENVLSQSILKLEETAGEYQSIKKKIREKYQPLIDRTESLLGLSAIAKVPVVDEEDEDELEQEEYRSEEEGNIHRLSDEEEETKPGLGRSRLGRKSIARRKKKQRAAQNVAGRSEEDSREGFSYKVFTEGSDAGKLESQLLEGDNKKKKRRGEKTRPTYDNLEDNIDLKDAEEDIRNYDEDEDYVNRGGNAKYSTLPNKEKDQALEDDSDKQTARLAESEHYSKASKPPQSLHKSEGHEKIGDSRADTLHNFQPDPESDYKNAQKTDREKSENKTSGVQADEEQGYTSRYDKTKDDPFNSDNVSDLKSSQLNYDSKNFQSKDQAYNSLNEKAKPITNDSAKKSNDYASYMKKVEKLPIAPQTNDPKREPQVQDRTRTYYKPKEAIIPGDPPTVVPILEEITHNAATDSSDSGVDNDGDSEESFYIEKNKAGQPVFARKRRPIKDGQRKEEPIVPEGDDIIEGHKLVPSEEWNRGKRVYKKEPVFVKVKKPDQTQWVDRKVDYFDVIDRDPETGEKKVVQEQNKVRTAIPPEEVAKEHEKATPHFAILQDDDGEYKVVKLNCLHPNPFDEKDDNATTAPGSERTIPVYEKLPYTFHDLPIFNGTDLKKVRATQDPETLASFLRQVAANPGARVTFWDQSNSTMDGKPILEAQNKVHGQGTEKLSRLVDKLIADGKVSNINPEEKATPAQAKSPTKDSQIKNSTAVGELANENARPTKEIEAIAVEGENHEGKPIYMLQEYAGRSDAEEETRVSDEESQLEMLRKALENSKKISDIEPIYSECCKACLQMTPDCKEQNRMLDELFSEVEAQVSKRGQPYNDGLFPAGPKSMVNNSLKSKQPYKDAPWTSLGEQFEFPVFLKDFNTDQLFPTGQPAPRLMACLAALCEFPHRIKKIFSSKDINREGLYGMKLHPQGKLESVIVDDKIPWNIDSNLGPLIFAPANVPECIRNPDLKRKRKQDLEAELWPHLIVKGMSKALGCYERMLNQATDNSLSDLTGMPVRTYGVNPTEMPFNWLRESFKRGYIVIGKATNKWVSKQRKSEGTSDEDYTYWTISQVVRIKEGEELVEVKNHLSPNPSPPEWSTDQFLKIKDDWFKYRRYKRRDRSGYWIPYEQLSEFFESIIVCRYREDYHSQWRRADSKNDGPISCVFNIRETCHLTVSLVQPDIVCCAPNHKYTILRTFLLNLPDATKETPNPLPILVKSAYNNPGKLASVEARLDPGKYRLLVDIESPNPESSLVLNLSAHSDKPFKWSIDFTPDSYKIHKDFLSTLAIQRGERNDLSEKGSLRKYYLSAKKIGMVLSAYVNRSQDLYSIGERMNVFRGKCSRPLEEGNILALHIPANARKLVYVRHSPTEECSLTCSEATYTPQY